METDIARLLFAIEKVAEVTNAEWRKRMQIGGFKVEEPHKEPETAEEFNDQVRNTMRAVIRGFKR